MLSRSTPRLAGTDGDELPRSTSRWVGTDGDVLSSSTPWWAGTDDEFVCVLEHNDEFGTNCLQDLIFGPLEHDDELVCLLEHIDELVCLLEHADELVCLLNLSRFVDWGSNNQKKVSKGNFWC